MEASRPLVAQMVPYMIKHYNKTCKIWNILCVIQCKIIRFHHSRAQWSSAHQKL